MLLLDPTPALGERCHRLLAGGRIAVLANWLYVKTDQQRKIAEEQKATAIAQRTEAQQQRAIAEAQRAEAQQQREEADRVLEAAQRVIPLFSKNRFSRYSRQVQTEVMRFLCIS